MDANDTGAGHRQPSRNDRTDPVILFTANDIRDETKPKQTQIEAAGSSEYSQSFNLGI
jgi:hypothetical protein